MAERNFRPTTSLLDMITGNGYRFFLFIFKDLKPKNDDVFYNTCNFMRGESNPSLQVYRNPKTNRWQFKDWGSPEYRGDMYNLAGFYYNLSPKTQFPEILCKMYDDLQIDSFPRQVIERCLLTWDTSELDFSHVNTNVSFSTPKVRSKELDSPAQEFSLDEYSYTDLLPAHKEWLAKFSISKDVMKEYEAVFIKGYTTYNRSGGESKFLPQENQIWIAYKYSKGCKVYCPNPKGFWYVGQRPKKYTFGTMAFDPMFDKEEILFLTAGEKDALVLLSKNYKAFCLSSETKNISRNEVRDWYQGNHCIVKVVYDNDETGVKQSIYLKKTLGLDYVIWPAWLKERGGKDVSDFFNLGGTTEEFDRLFTPNYNIPEVITVEDQLVAAHSNLAPIKYSVRTAMERIEDAGSQKDIIPLFDVFLQSNELSILFGDTGIGKSIIAVSIADSISKGQGFLGFSNSNPSIKVLYLDFELSDKQFQKRYTNDLGVPYPFSNNLFIDNLNISSFYEKDKKVRFEEKLLQEIETKISEIGAELLVVDNITFLSTHSAEDGEIAMTIMKLLKDLKTSLGITILVLAHTPKQFGNAGITLKDLAGSKHLSNFADGVFALGASNDKSIRYLKQVKPSRSAELIYDSNNVLVCELTKEGSFLTFINVGLRKESDLIGRNNEEEKIGKAIELKAKGKSYKEIAAILLTSKSTVGRWLKDK